MWEHMTQTVESALQTTFRLVMAQDRREKGNAVGRINRKRLTVSQLDVSEYMERGSKNGGTKGVNLTLSKHLFEPSKSGRSPMYQLDKLVVDAEFAIVSNDSTSVRYFRIKSVRQREVSKDWYVRLI